MLPAVQELAAVAVRAGAYNVCVGECGWVVGWEVCACTPQRHWRHTTAAANTARPRTVGPKRGAQHGLVARVALYVAQVCQAVCELTLGSKRAVPRRREVAAQLRLKPRVGTPTPTAAATNHTRGAAANAAGACYAQSSASLPSAPTQRRHGADWSPLSAPPPCRRACPPAPKVCHVRLWRCHSIIVFTVYSDVPPPAWRPFHPLGGLLLVWNQH